MSGDVSLDVLAGGFHDKTDHDNQQHEQKPLHTAKDVDDFGQSQFGAATKDGGDDADNGQKTVLPETRRDVRVQRGLNGRQETVDKRD